MPPQSITKNQSNLIDSQKAGIYVHIPFCIKKCDYCNFFSITDMSFKKQFLNALLHEIEIVAKDVQISQLFFDSLYIGGGTPSLFDPKEISEIIQKIDKNFKLATDVEITLEVNPGTINSTSLTRYKEIGINRLSIGIQSFNDQVLSFLGRIHSARDAELAVYGARKAGFKNISLDLIYGIPGQTEKSWQDELQKTVCLRPEHLSCYMLTYESGTHLYKNMEKRTILPLSDQLVGNLFKITQEFLYANGYFQYEISNFALDRKTVSRHNIKYWSFLLYIGLGPSAHSYIHPVRYWNYSDVLSYIQKIKTNKQPVSGKEKLTFVQQIMEFIYLGLRTTHGIDIKNFQKKFNIDFNQTFKEVIDDLKTRNLIKITPCQCMLSNKGMLFLDSIADMFIARL